MMLRFTCLALLVSLAVGLELKAQIKDHWQSFKSAHKKSYAAGEENKRQEIFKKNVEVVLMHNLKADLGEATHHLGINKFADMTHEEFKGKMMGLKFVNKTSPRYAPLTESRVTVPATKDWRASNVITPVKDQGECGSCWTFSTTGSLEAAYAIAKGKQVTLSEQQLVDCSTDGNAGCNGGVMDYAYDYIIQNGGIVRSACYPYEESDGQCRFSSKRSCIGATMTDYRDIRQGDENDLLVAVAKIGPVAIGFDADQPDFQFHKHGVYNPSYCSQTPTHAVLVIGYGTEDGQAYWLIKNSWGATWGEAGYFKLARNAGNKCGVTNMASYPII